MRQPEIAFTKQMEKAVSVVSDGFSRFVRHGEISRSATA